MSDLATVITAAERRAFEARAACVPDVAALQAAACDAKAAALSELAAAFVHCAFANPEAAEAVYGALRNGRLGKENGAKLAQSTAAPLSATFWDAFWDLQQERRAGAMDARTTTSRIAALGAFMAPSLRARAEKIAACHPKAAGPATRMPPPRLSLDEIARQPENSLAHDFCRQIVDNKFDLEVLDRETMNLAALPPALRYLNTRILQMHDIWHLVGGFRTTVLHEIAISAFQQAQFTHGYSAMFLAVVVSGMALRGATNPDVILQTIAEASQYGVDMPSFMAIAWEEEWHEPLHSIRARHGIVPFKGSIAADYFEGMRPAASVKSCRLDT